MFCGTDPRGHSEANRIKQLEDPVDVDGYGRYGTSVNSQAHRKLGRGNHVDMAHFCRARRYYIRTSTLERYREGGRHYTEARALNGVAPRCYYH